MFLPVLGADPTLDSAPQTMCVSPRLLLRDPPGPRMHFSRGTPLSLPFSKCDQGTATPKTLGELVKKAHPSPIPAPIFLIGSESPAPVLGTRTLENADSQEAHRPPPRSFPPEARAVSGWNLPRSLDVTEPTTLAAYEQVGLGPRPVPTSPGGISARPSTSFPLRRPLFSLQFPLSDFLLWPQGVIVTTLRLRLEAYKSPHPRDSKWPFHSEARLTLLEPSAREGASS